MTATDVAGTKLSLTLPEQWGVIDLDPEAFARAAREAMPEGGPPPLNEDELPAFRAYLRRAMGRLDDAGIVLFAAFADSLDAGEGNPPHLMMAALTIAAVSEEQIGGHVTPHLVRAALKNRDTGMRQRALDHPSDVRLPAGTAVYQPSLVRVRSGRGTVPDAMIALERYVLPVRGGMAVIDFQSPNLPFMEEFRGWFRDIAASVVVQ